MKIVVASCVSCVLRALQISLRVAGHVGTHVVMLQSKFCVACFFLSEVSGKRSLLINIHDKRGPATLTLSILLFVCSLLYYFTYSNAVQMQTSTNTNTRARCHQIVYGCRHQHNRARDTEKYGNIREVAAYISIGTSMGIFGLAQMFPYCIKYMLDRAKS